MCHASSVLGREFHKIECTNEQETSLPLSLTSLLYSKSRKNLVPTRTVKSMMGRERSVTKAMEVAIATRSSRLVCRRPNDRYQSI